MAMALAEPREPKAGDVFAGFPLPESPLHLSYFFKTLYQRYEERFVYGASLLADRGITTRFEWDPESPVFLRDSLEPQGWPTLDFTPRVAALVGR